RLLSEINILDQIPVLLKILAKTAEFKDNRVRNLNADFVNLLLRNYEISLSPSYHLLVKFAEDFQVGPMICRLSEGKTDVLYSINNQTSSVLLELDVSPGDLVNQPSKKLSIVEINLRRAWEGFMHCTT